MSLKLLLLLLIVALILGYTFSRNRSKPIRPIRPKVRTVIVTGESNPGRIAIHTKRSSRFTKRSIDTGFRYVYTVRIGDAQNDGQNRIYAGVGNGFYDEPHGCQVLMFDPNDDFKKTVVDETLDLRCKDLTIGDVDDDGKNELVLGTHGQGVVNIYSFKNQKWQKQQIDENPIAIYDQKNNTNHKIDNLNIPYDGTIQTAVHIVKIGDADNDGKNELLATISDPLEYPGSDHVAFWKLYRLKDGKWQTEIIDTQKSPIPFKATIDVVDIDNDGKNEVLVGSSHHQLLLYRFQNGRWQKQILDQEEGGDEDNMKGVTTDNLENKKAKSIVVATGIPQAAVYQYDLEGQKVNKKQLINISELLKPYKIFEGVTDNSLDAKIVDIDGDGQKEIAVGGISESSLLADKLKVTKFGWETTILGFTTILSPQGNGKYTNNFLDFHSVLALDVGQIAIK